MIRRWSWLFLPSFLLLHCGDDDATGSGSGADAGSSGSSSSSGATGSDGGGAPGPDGGDGTDSGGGPSGDDHEGIVTIVENNTMSEGAQFVDVPEKSRCAIRTVDTCVVSICPDVNPNDPTALSKEVGFGSVTVQGGTSPTFTLTKGMGAVQATSPWKPGDTLAIASTGDVVPAFSTSLVYPSSINVTAPAPAVPDYTIPVKRADGVPFAWTSTAPVAGDASVTILQTQTGKKVTVQCDFPQTAGTGTVPPAALSDLVAGGDARKTAITMSPFSKKILQAGPYRVVNSILRFNPYYAVYGIVQ